MKKSIIPGQFRVSNQGKPGNNSLAKFYYDQTKAIRELHCAYKSERKNIVLSD